MSTQSAQTREMTRAEAFERGRQSGRGDAGYTLLLERMTIQQWDAFVDGEIGAEALQAKVLNGGDGR